jgi:hypothetical protein
VSTQAENIENNDEIAVPFCKGERERNNHLPLCSPAKMWR